MCEKSINWFYFIYDHCDTAQTSEDIIEITFWNSKNLGDKLV